MASGKHEGNPSSERRTDELCGICELCAHIRMENGETVSIKTTEQIKGYVTTSEFVKMLRSSTLTSYKGDGIERPIKTREEVYPPKEKARKPRYKTEEQGPSSTASALAESHPAPPTYVDTPLR